MVIYLKVCVIAQIISCVKLIRKVKLPGEVWPSLTKGPRLCASVVRGDFGAFLSFILTRQYHLSQVCHPRIPARRAGRKIRECCK